MPDLAIALDGTTTLDELAALMRQYPTIGERNSLYKKARAAGVSIDLWFLAQRRANPGSDSREDVYC